MIIFSIQAWFLLFDLGLLQDLRIAPRLARFANIKLPKAAAM